MSTSPDPVALALYALAVGHTAEDAERVLGGSSLRGLVRAYRRDEEGREDCERMAAVLRDHLGS